MKLTLSVRAQERREEIYFYYLTHDNSQAGNTVRGRIDQAIARLAEFPKSGRTTDIPNRREMVVTGTPYLMRYTLTTKEIRITDIKHGAQNQWKP